MYKSKKVSIVVIFTVLSIGIGMGLIMARNNAMTASAEDDGSSEVDGEDLEEIYQAAFGRSADDEGKRFHLGKDLKQVLHDINNSDERRYYSALFKSVKAYEQAVRAPGTVSDADKQLFLNNINTALATLIAWVETLPEQDICRGVVGAEEARAAIQAAFAKMSPAAQLVAQRGIFKALDAIGGPKDQRLPSLRCLATPTPSASPTATP